MEMAEWIQEKSVTMGIPQQGTDVIPPASVKGAEI